MSHVWRLEQGLLDWRPTLQEPYINLVLNALRSACFIVLLCYTETFSTWKRYLDYSMGAFWCYLFVRELVFTSTHSNCEYCPQQGNDDATGGVRSTVESFPSHCNKMSVADENLARGSPRVCNCSKNVFMARQRLVALSISEVRREARSSQGRDL